MKKHLRLTAIISAVLAFLLLVSGCASGSAQAIITAVYPVQAKYPEGEMLPDFEERYTAWSESRRAMRENFGAGEGLDGFFEKTISEFLAEKEDNVVYSPLNVYMALAMLAEITDGESRSQILSLLGASDTNALKEQAKKVWLANYSNDGALTSILASSLWLSEHVNYNNETLESLAENYYASSFKGEMGSTEFNKLLQNWINGQTGNLLSDDVSGIELDPHTVLALYTTIYFQAKWENEFSKSNNSERIFHAASGDVTREFMNKTETYGRYFFGENFGATRISLENSGDMWFILPDEDASVNELVKDGEVLNFITSNGVWDNQKSLRVNVSLPKFDVKSKLDLADGLKNLGVTDCFDAKAANFSPLLDSGLGCWLDKVNHGARVKIDEEGVTAAAYTEMLLAGAAMPPKDEIDFILDRPFIFVITGSDGLPLFVGAVNNP